MISVVIPTLNAERSLGAALAALVAAAVDGLLREVIVVDGGSSDRTLLIADDAGAEIVKSAAGRGTQLAAGAEAARAPWLLFLHADTVLDPAWADEAGEHMRAVDTGRRPDTAGAFRFALDDRGLAPRIVEAGVAIRSRWLGLPYGDQGLLISRQLYDEVGGYRAIPIMEDVDLVRRIGRKRLVAFDARALTSAVRFRRDGYVRRVLRNQACIAMFLAGRDPARIAGFYSAAVTLGKE